jgi:membrane protease YdiL (CAAX protease family)
VANAFLYSDAEPAAPDAPPIAPIERLRALAEVLLCSGVPTQVAIGQLLTLVGLAPFSADGTPQAAPLFALALLDTLVVLVLVVLLLQAGGERVAPLMLGTRSVARESVLGLMLVPVLFIGVGVTVLVVRGMLPWSHNVPLNPFSEFLKTPRSAGIFAVVAIVAGGLREEVQRVFLLHRFERYLGGATVGLFIVSAAFGAGHALQGWDASIATSLLGLTWGWIYLRRRSAVAPIVSHAGYNAAQIAQAIALQGLRV